MDKALAPTVPPTSDEPSAPGRGRSFISVFREIVEASTLDVALLGLIAGALAANLNSSVNWNGPTWVAGFIGVARASLIRSWLVPNRREQWDRRRAVKIGHRRPKASRFALLKARINEPFRS